MRIVSRKRDYYDGVQGMDQDRSMSFIRTERTVHYDLYAKEDKLGNGEQVIKAPFPFDSYLPGYDTGVTINHYTVGFCGKTYPCLNLRVGYEGQDNFVSEFCYTADHVDDFMRKNFPKIADAYGSPLAKDHEWWRSRVGNRWPRERARGAFEKYFEGSGSDAHAKLFEEAKTPVFIAEKGNYRSGGTITYNDLLKDVHFQRVFAPYQAYQEIVMWFNNMAFPNPPMIEMSNEDTAARLGHGDKYSFRRPPSKKKG